MKLQLEGQYARIRLGETELDQLLAGEALTGRTQTSLGTWQWGVVLGRENGLTQPVPGECRLTLAGVAFRAFSAERPRRDGFLLDLPVPDADPLQISVEIDVRESRRRRSAATTSR